jgi:hypothetical protein
MSVDGWASIDPQGVNLESRCLFIRLSDGAAPLALRALKKPSLTNDQLTIDDDFWLSVVVPAVVAAISRHYGFRQKRREVSPMPLCIFVRYLCAHLSEV